MNSRPVRPELAGLAFLCLFLIPAPARAQDIRIVSADYRQYFHTSEAVEFIVVVENRDAVAQFAEVDVTLTNIDTEQETTLTPVLTGTAAAGGRVTLINSYAVPDGQYTVTFPLFDGNGVRRDTLNGKYPLRIGSESESVRVFPDVINLGTIPPGRYQHPIPVEVTWRFFRFNQLRQAQPFTIRLYTDNAGRYGGVPGAMAKVSPAGLVHMSGRYALSMKVWSLNFGPDIQESGWDSPLAGPPPVDEDDYWLGPPLLEGTRSFGSAAWARVPDLVDMTSNPIGWRRMIGQDQYDDRFVSCTNSTGDYTLRSPFTFYIATEAGAAAVEGVYSSTLVVELWSP